MLVVRSTPYVCPCAFSGRCRGIAGPAVPSSDALCEARSDPRSHVVARSGDMVHVEIAMDAMPQEVVHVVEGNLRQVIGVQSVTQLRPSALQRIA